MSSGFARRRLAGWRRDARGATAVEFALVSPVLVLLLVGTFQVAWAVHCASSVRWSLEQSSRNLLLDPTTTQDQIKTAMVSQLKGLVDSSRLTVSLTSSSAGGTPVFLVSSTYAAPLSIPFVNSQLINFTATATVPQIS